MLRLRGFECDGLLCIANSLLGGLAARVAVALLDRNFSEIGIRQGSAVLGFGIVRGLRGGGGGLRDDLFDGRAVLLITRDFEWGGCGGGEKGGYEDWK
jgi:hypothetical protein